MGGMLSPKHTNETRLTPAVAKDALITYRTLIYGWNRHLERSNLEPVTLGCPVGSTTHINDDLIDNPHIEYGDIDYLVTLPYPKSFSGDWTERKAKELEIEKAYKRSFKEFIECQEDERVLASNGMIVVIQTPSGNNVQVDMITTFPLYFEWMRRRYGPEKGKKGYLFGCLYTALGDVLTLSFGTLGVQARLKDGKRVTNRKRKNTTIDKISVNPMSFLSDTLYYLTAQYSNSLYISDDKLSSLADGIVRFSTILDGDESHKTANKILKQYEANLWKQLSKKEKEANKKGHVLTAGQTDDISFDIYSALAQFEESKNNL